ncbi:Choline-ethanolamine transporter [Golovinomyces cichoracearum]|uniref:Choline-ethanolamine transporter n=1 Tax=Golovinomyces cichoracearum TaxID=62708 RepID=A0A420J443_9PEZI|nr:Choline-ethanolamine transporter [Golovinomyces cichoracearum]
MADVETIGFSNNEEDRALEHLGYKPRESQPYYTTRKIFVVIRSQMPELKRSFGPWGMIGFSFSIVTWYVVLPEVVNHRKRLITWSALGGVLVTGVNAGGPPVSSLSFKYTDIKLTISGYDLGMGGGQYFLAMRGIFHGRDVFRVSSGWWSILMGLPSLR